jgi:hypothetical protein
MTKRTEQMMRIIVLAVFMAVFVSAAGVLQGRASAQDQPADAMQIFVEKMKADKKLLVAVNMQLTEAEAKAFWPIYEKYQAELFLIRARTSRLIDNYAAAYDKMTDPTAKKLIDESMTIETLRLKLAKTYISKFRAVLSDIKVARYYQIENKVNAVLYYEIAKNIPLVKTEK